MKTNHIQCFLDGRLVHDLDYQPMKSLFASATHDSKTGDIILKVVNAANSPVSTDIHLRGAGNLHGLAKAIVLAANSPLDENSLEAPTKVSPQTDTFGFQGDNLRRTFPGNSVTVLRFAANNQSVP